MENRLSEGRIEEIKTIMIEVKERDQKLQKELIIMDGDVDLVKRRYEEHVQTFTLILDEVGYVGSDVFGDEAAQAAFLVVQHSGRIHDALKKKYLELMKGYDGEVKPENIALLEDLVLVTEGKRQKYGTRIKIIDDVSAEFLPIKDVDNVDRNRVSLGLDTLAEYTERYEQVWGRKVNLPDGYIIQE